MGPNIAKSVNYKIITNKLELKISQIILRLLTTSITHVIKNDVKDHAQLKRLGIFLMR